MAQKNNRAREFFCKWPDGQSWPYLIARCAVSTHSPQGCASPLFYFGSQVLTWRKEQIMREELEFLVNFLKKDAIEKERRTKGQEYNYNKGYDNGSANTLKLCAKWIEEILKQDQWSRSTKSRFCWTSMENAPGHAQGVLIVSGGTWSRPGTSPISGGRSAKPTLPFCWPGGMLHLRPLTTSLLSLLQPAHYHSTDR